MILSEASSCPHSPLARPTSVAGELAVRHPVRARGVRTEARDLVLLVRLEVALEPVPVRRILVGALVGQDVGRDAVEEPPVVGDDDGADEGGDQEQRHQAWKELVEDC